MRQLEAVLWDHDGTLVDTEPYWIDAEMDLAASFGVTWTHAQALACVGNPMPESARLIQDAGVPMGNTEIIEHLVDRVAVLMDEKGIPWLPGVQTMFAQLAEADIPCAIVSNAWRKVVEKTVAGLPQGIIRAFIAGDEMVRAKPDPWPYAHAAELLGATPEGCLVVEDSVVGAESGEAAGMRVIVVPSMIHVPETPMRTFVDGLEGLTLHDLRLLLNGQPSPAER